MKACFKLVANIQKITEATNPDFTGLMVIVELFKLFPSGHDPLAVSVGFKGVITPWVVYRFDLSNDT